ncbi:MAG: hypothetical protein OEW70_06230, partial [candidate division WOR-3 bacterium]|nr:hypothetical protein [candidate division WOR-3 bacterium]
HGKDDRVSHGLPNLPVLFSFIQNFNNLITRVKIFSFESSGNYALMITTIEEKITAIKLFVILITVITLFIAVINQEY